MVYRTHQRKYPANCTWLAGALFVLCACSGKLVIPAPQISHAPVAAETLCTPVNPTATCPTAGTTCVDGTCYAGAAAPATCAAGVNGLCAGDEACIQGVCTPISTNTACSTAHPAGLCPGGQACADGFCYTDDGSVTCSSQTLQGVCPQGQTCRSGTCVTFFPTCGPTDFNGTCPTWSVCAAGVCAGPAPPDQCSIALPHGRCPANEVCVAGTCTGIAASNVCSLATPTGLCLANASCAAGACVQLTPADACSPAHPAGLCGAGEVCTSGVCHDLPCGQGGQACSPGQWCAAGVCTPLPCDGAHPNSACTDTTQACVGGVCQAPTCSSVNPNGVCEAGLVCARGVCQLPACSAQSPLGPCPDPVNQVCMGGACVLRPCSVNAPDGACTGLACTDDPEYGCIFHMPAVCCDANLVGVTGCNLGTCSPPACSVQNPNGACSSGVCVQGSCHPAPCSPFYLDGYCTDANQSCVEGGCAKVGCATQTASDPNVFCSPYVCDPLRNVCIQPPCSPTHPRGSCSAGLACCSTNSSDVNYDPTCPSTGTCHTPLCSATYPGGVCLDANQVCANGACTTPPCSPSYPHGICGPNFACNANACRLLPCAQSAGSGYCAAGNICAVRNGSPACVPFVCSNAYPDGPCIGAGQLGDVCVNANVSGSPNYICVEPNCTTQYPGGICHDTNDICASGQCILANCSQTHPHGPCPRSQTCTGGRCVLNACANADPRDSGACDNGYVCCNNALVATTYCDSSYLDSCVAISCSPQFPSGPCNSDDQICVTQSGVTSCQSVCGPYASMGYCPGGFACISSSCVASCANDQDCDTISDFDEGLAMLVDTDGNGVPDAYSHDSDSDGIPDSVEAGDANISTPPKISTPGGIPNFRSQDSDSDYLQDTLEAGAAPAVPVDTDGDGLPNYADPDSDGDGILDKCEAVDVGGIICSNNMLLTQSFQLVDSDNDGIPDVLSLDSDADGVPDAVEARARPADPTSLNPNGIIHSGGIPDYRNTDSDADGLLDGDEDKNGNGVVDCQLDGNGLIVADYRAIPACGQTSAPFGTYPHGQPYDFNPGCPAQKCLFAETNRVFADTDDNGIADQNDTVATVCSSANLKPINIYHSQQADYAFAVEQTFNLARTVSTNSNAVGILVDDNQSSNGSSVVGGLLLRRKASMPAIRTTGGSTPAEVLINKALAQAQNDQFLLTQWNNNGNVSVVLNRNTTSFDGYGVAITRYRVLTSSNTSVGMLRDEIAVALAGSLDGFVAQDNGPQVQDFTVTLETVYRYDDGVSNGIVMTVGAVAPTGVDSNDVSTYSYRTQCSLQNDSLDCVERPGCTWDGNSLCYEDPTYQLPLFFFDNLTNGSALAQYGDGESSLCESLLQKNNLIDFLWTIDNSGSMSSSIAQVAQASALFFPFMNKTEADYRVGLTTQGTLSGTWPPLMQTECIHSQGSCNSTVCRWLGSPNNVCVSRCALPVTGNGNCLTEPGCGIHNGTCVYQGCSGITTSSGCSSAGCIWRNNACVLDGALDLLEGKIAADFTGAVGGATNANAIDRSSHYACSEGCVVGSTCCPECAGNPNLVPNDPACYFAARLPADNGPGNEHTLTLTEWALYRAGARSVCSTLSSAGSCAALPYCFWDSTAPIPACVENYCNTGFTSNQNNADNTAQQQCNGWPAATNGSLEPIGTPVSTTQHNNPAAAFMPINCEWNPVAGVCYPQLSPVTGTATLGTNSPRCNALTTSARCALEAPQCRWSSTGGTNGYCVPYEPPQTVMCNGTTQTSCQAQGWGTCEWDSCSYTTQNQCLAVYGCAWTNNACHAPAAGGTCRAPLRRMMRNNATKVSILMSDEEDCYIKDGPNGPNNRAAYDGTCTENPGGFLLFNDPVRWARTAAFSNFMVSRDILMFSITGDPPDITKVPYVSGYTAHNGGCTKPVNGDYADAGKVYIDVAESTSGGWGTICTANLFPTIESIGVAALSRSSPYVLEGFIQNHAVQPIAATVEVAVQTCTVASEYPVCQSGTQAVVVGRSRDNGFDYDASNNALMLFGSARPAAGGLITASYKYWVNNIQPPGGTYGLCPCPAASEPACTCPAGQACGFTTSGHVTTNHCTPMMDSGDCALTPGCYWNTANSGSCEVDGLCAPDPTCGGSCPAGNVCDPTRGLCICDPSCGGSCNPGQTCDNNENVNGCSGETQAHCSGNCGWDADLGACVSNTCGQCVCDRNCNGGCPAGEICNTNTASPDCGQCACDLTCGGCGPHEVCNNDPNSPTCGICGPYPCGSCPAGFVCSPSADICICDTTCGGGTPPAGQICDGDPNSATCGQTICDTSCGAPCPAHTVCNTDPNSSSCGFCGPDPRCAEPNGMCNVSCSAGNSNATCTAMAGCEWKRDVTNNFACYPQQCFTCDAGTGYCVADAQCAACGCNSYERCEASSGRCVCDTACSATQCPAGSKCNSNEASSSCGQCICDTTCGGPCGAGLKCDTSGTSGTCGTCIIDSTCGGGCAYPLVCSATTGLCGPDPHCGYCPTGYVCNVITGTCQPSGG